MKKDLDDERFETRVGAETERVADELLVDFDLIDQPGEMRQWSTSSGQADQFSRSVLN